MYKSQNYFIAKNSSKIVKCLCIFIGILLIIFLVGIVNIILFCLSGLITYSISCINTEITKYKGNESQLKSKPKEQECQEIKSEVNIQEDVPDYAEKYLSTLLTKEQLSPYGVNLHEQLTTYARQHVTRQPVSKYILTVPKDIWVEENVLAAHSINYILNISDEDVLVRTNDTGILKVYSKISQVFKTITFNMYTEDMVPPELYKSLYSSTSDIEEYILQSIPEQERINWGTMPREQCQNYCAYHLKRRG